MHSDGMASKFETVIIIKETPRILQEQIETFSGGSTMTLMILWQCG